MGLFDDIDRRVQQEVQQNSVGLQNVRIQQTISSQQTFTGVATAVSGKTVTVRMDDNSTATAYMGTRPITVGDTVVVIGGRCM